MKILNKKLSHAKTQRETHGGAKAHELILLA